MALPAEIPRVSSLPVVGNMIEFRRDRLRLQRRLADECGDIGVFRMGPLDVLSVASPELAHEVLVERERSFKKAPGLAKYAKPLLGEGLLTSERELHRRQRRLLAPAFAPKQMSGYAEAMARESARAAAGWRDGDEMDLAEGMMRLTLAIVGRTLFNADLSGDAGVIAEALPICMDAMMTALSSPLQLPPEWPLPRNVRMRRAVARLDALIFRMIREARARNRDEGDVLSVLLVARDDDGTAMTDQQVRDEVMTLVLAGHETTANAMAWTFYLLDGHPEIRERVAAEARAALGERPPTFDDLARLPFALQVVKEAMRLFPPAYVVARQAVEPVTIGGHRCPAGTVVVVNIYGMHRRAKYFAAPERFDPDRFAPEREKHIARGAYLPFGAGSRVCIGNHFALMEAQLILATLAPRLRFERTTRGPIAGDPLVTLRPHGGVPVRVRRLTPGPGKEAAAPALLA